MKTATMAEGHDLLKRTRAGLIWAGRAVARQIARRDGKVNARQVREEMETMGLLAGYTGTDHWLGPLFQGGEFERTGETVLAKSDKIHGRLIPVWRLRGAT